ncbi:putative FMRFamide-like neuropeptide [Dirofilaria immitis]
MEATGWIMNMIKLIIIIITITTSTTTTTLYVPMDNSNSYRPQNDAYEPGITDLLIKQGLFRLGKDNYGTDYVYNQKLIPDTVQFGENGYEKKDVPGVLRFGKREGDIPGVLRFGKRNDDIPGVLRFGKRSVPGVLRFGRH